MVNYTAVDGLIPFDDNSTEYLNVTENACGRSETGEQKVLDYGVSRCRSAELASLFCPAKCQGRVVNNLRRKSPH